MDVNDVIIIVIFIHLISSLPLSNHLSFKLKVTTTKRFLLAAMIVGQSHFISHSTTLQLPSLLPNIEAERRWNQTLKIVST
jgi:hypothetical protein